MKVAADRDRCIGAGMCVMTDPEVFDQDDDGIVVLLDADTERAAAVRTAISLCPSAALSLVEP